MLEFCSKLGYNYGFDGSDEEEISELNASTQQKSLKKIRKADTNILCVKLEKLTQSNKICVNKPVQCKKCGAYLSHLSLLNISIHDSQTDKQWHCEFCSELNLIPFDYECVKEFDFTCLLEKPATKSTDKNDEKSGESLSADDNLFTFCIDTSGSMDVNVGKGPTNQFGGFNLFRAPAPGLSRLDAIKSACIENLKRLKIEEPLKKVSLVTFSSDVQYYGDCTQLKNNSTPLITIKDNKPFGGFGVFGAPINQKPILLEAIYENDVEMVDENEIQPETIASILKQENILQDKQQLLRLAQLTDGQTLGISLSFSQIESLMLKLTAGGGTALGPALVFSIGMCKRVGSQICLVTDGAANIGVGGLEATNGEQFYEEMGKYAAAKGIIINVITVEGTDCRLAILGRLADITNGNLNIVDPERIGDEFKSILTNVTKAMNVKVKLIVNHKYVYIRDDDVKAAEAKAIESNSLNEKEKVNELKQSVHIKEIGAVKRDTEVYFDYGMRRVKNCKDVIDEMPFQIQVEYTTADEAKHVRVITLKKKFTTDRSRAEQSLISSDLIFSSTTQNMANQVIKGNVQSSLFSGFGCTAIADRLQLTQPAMFATIQTTVSALDKNVRFGNLTDQTACFVFGSSKCSTSTLNNINKK